MYKIQKDFFGNPDQVREYALKQTYDRCDFYQQNNGIWSGYRCQIRDASITNEIVQKLETVWERKIQLIITNFCINTASSGVGFPHSDDKNMNIAGVIYLNRNAPPETGTTLYEDSNEEFPQLRSKMEIVYSQQIPPRNKIKEKFITEIQQFKKEQLKQIVSFENEYNLMVSYSSDYLHSPDCYFGRAKEDSRLTVGFFAKFE